MKKIACIGTHSVGKSTLCYQLAERGKRAGENVHVIQERVRFSPFPINADMVYETAIWACCNQISKELEAQQKGFSLIICDRSCYDPFIYARHNNLRHPIESSIEKLAMDWLQSYDEVYFVRPRKEHVALSDGVRSTDKDFIFDIDYRFDHFIKMSAGFFNPTVIYTDEIFT
jgi:nicotinamide riboside kinase